MLILAELQFQQALSLEGSRHSEPWIYHFMLAKISYKLKKPASVILEHFVKVITTIQPKSLLHNNMYGPFNDQKGIFHIVHYLLEKYIFWNN